MKRLIIFLFQFFLLSSLFAYENSSQIDASKKALIGENETSIIIKTSVSDAEVYLNGVFQGYSSLKITNLIPGIYNLEIRKRNYESVFCSVLVRKGFSLEYDFELSLLKGTLFLNDVAAGSDIYIDGTKVYSTRNEIVIGSHEVVVRKFGYEDFREFVTINPYAVKTVFVVYKEAEFVLKDFKSSKKVFNPEYKNDLGKCRFSFYVTSDSSAEITIVNKDDEVVVSKKYNSFSTWNQYFSWDGLDSNGNILPEGQYTATIVSGDFEFSTKVKIDNSVQYNLTSITNSGSGIGNLPVVMHTSTNEIKMSLGFEPEVYYFMNGFSFNKLSLDVDFSFSFLNHFEVSFSGSGFRNSFDYSSFEANGSFRAFDEQQLGDKYYLCYGALIRYGLASYTEIFRTGIDNGSGLGAGLVCGFDLNKVYLGVSSEYLFGASNGNLFIDNRVWKNGLSVIVKPTKEINFGVWGALNSAFNINNSFFVENNTYWLRAFDFGVEANFMPFATSMVISVQGRSQIYANNITYFSSKISLSYFF